ncbi:hypothetical protein [uncultured Ferrimonas sp.]|uniref:hypothetical protein n=1 Tax=uncultured Ferrimonas sp. TaxID=432640 RepID=UPI00262476CF|nr:hypothetical protein [uncultured Ferrimonas sp.]
MTEAAGPSNLAANPLSDRGALQERFWQYLITEAPPVSRSALDPSDDSYWQGKLAIERAAQQQRIADQQAQQQAIAQCQQRFIAHFDKELERLMASPALITKDSPITPRQLDLLDELLSPQVNRHRLFTQLSAMADLSNALIRYVNRQQRQRQASDVTNVRLAFNFLGIEQLQQVLPWLLFQLWRPHGPASLRQRKLWRMVQQQKRFAGQVAPSFNVSKGLAEGLAVLQAVDIMLLLHLGELCFNRLKHNWLSQARQAGEKIAHQAIFELRLPSEQLLKQWQRPHLWGYQTMAGQLSAQNKRWIGEMAQRDYHKLSNATEVIAHAHLMTISSTLRRRRLAAPEQLNLWRCSYPSLADATNKHA